MAIDSKHPLYTAHLDDWILLRDCYRGERRVKEQGVIYLSPTSGMEADGMNPGQLGEKAYQAYKRRAVFPDAVKMAVSAMIGVMHHKPPVIEVPKIMEPMLERATLNGESLEMLLRKINTEQLTTGRLGLMLDIEDGALVGSMPYIATYDAESILNWDDGTRQELALQNLNLVVLDESDNERGDDFEWSYKHKYRVLVLGDPTVNEAQGGGVYQAGEFTEKGTAFSVDGLVTPAIGGRTLDQIPFVFVNATDVVPSPQNPPLLGLATLSMTIYRGEADYRQALFMQGQDTLVVIGGGEESFRTGANAVINLQVGGDAKFIGVDSAGLPEMRQALENDRSQATQQGGQLLDNVSRERESGDALKIRVAASTATLNQVALAGAFGLQSLLRIAAVWLGANPEEVVVEPNLDFADDELLGKTLVEYMTAKSLGAPYSLRSIHELMQQRDLTSRTFEEEIEELEKEQELLDMIGIGSSSEDGPEEEDEPKDEGKPKDQLDDSE